MKVLFEKLFCNAKEEYEWTETQIVSGQILINRREDMTWIDVQSELPEPSIKCQKVNALNKVLICSPSTVGITTGYYWGETNDNDPMKGWSIMGVTHWMPLPESPKA